MKNEIIPQFEVVGNGFSIREKKTLRTFDCRRSNQVRAACEMFVIRPCSSKYGMQHFIKRLNYKRIVEYLIKHKRPEITPNPFDYFVDMTKISRCYKSIKPDYIYSNDDAKLIIKLFTTDDINVAVDKSRLTTGSIADWHKKEFEEKSKKRLAAENKNNDLFNEQAKTSNNKDDSLHSVLFDGIDKDDFNALRERCKLIRNIVHLHTCNNAGLERILSETEKVTDNYLLEKDKQEIKSCLDLDDIPPERIKEILKLIKGAKAA